MVCGRRHIGFIDPKCRHCKYRKDLCSAERERNFVFESLSNLHNEHPIAEIISGNESGIEQLALRWATENQVPHQVWKRQLSQEGLLTKSIHILSGRKMGQQETKLSKYIRMLEQSNPELVVSLGGGASAFAVIKAAKKKEISVMEIDLPFISECPH